MHQMRWYSYMRDSIVEATLSRDVISLESVPNPQFSELCSCWVRSTLLRRSRFERKTGRRLGMTRFVLENTGTRALTVGSPEAPIESFLCGDIPLFD
jgi:hypothetical protein